MIILNLRTIAFISSVSCLIQSILWIVGYILYILAYSCSYSHNSSSHKESYNDLHFKSLFYFQWYFQGSNCVESTEWLSKTRNQTSNIIVALLSTGFSLNSWLFISSIFIILGLNDKYNVRLFIYRINFYVACVYIVSIWDAILVGFVSSDIAPLLKIKNYNDEKNTNTEDGSDPTKPDVIVLPYMIEVATVTIMLLSRFIVIWICNVLLATFMIFKKSGEGASSSPPPLPPITYESENNKASDWRQNIAISPEAENGLYFKSNGLQRYIAPILPLEDPPDEVPNRWTEYNGVSENRKYSNVDDFEDDRRRQSFRMDNNFDKGNFSAAEMHIRSSLHKWRDPSTRGLNEESLRQHPTMEPIRTPTIEPKKPSLLTNIRNSFRRNQSETTIPENITGEALPDSPPITRKKPEGFNYTVGIDLFNVKLRHVDRPSLSKASSSLNPENSEKNEELFYKVSSVTELNDLYTPHVPPIPKEPAPTYSSNEPETPMKSPPVPPPLQKAKTNYKTPQISLDEALRTRGPLRPVKRPAIDTSC